MTNGNIYIPIIYRKMHERGYLNAEKDSYLWMNEMEWLTIDQIMDYEYEEDEIQTFVPFAFTGRGDHWVWVTTEEDRDYPVGLCICDDTIGKYYAKNTEDAIMRHIIDFVSDANFYISEDESYPYQISEQDLRDQLLEWKNCLNGILKEEYLQIIGNLSQMKLKRVESQYGDWYALLSLEEQKEYIARYFKFDLLDEEFDYCTD